MSVPSISKDVFGLVITLGFSVKVVEVVFANKVVFVGLVTIHIKRMHNRVDKVVEDHDDLLTQ